MDNQTEDRIFVIKGRIKASTSSLYGIILLIVNNYKKLESYNVLLSTYSSIYDTNFDDEWYKIEEIIINQKWRGDFNKNLTAAITDQFKAMAEDSRAMTLFYENLINSDYKNLDHTLYEQINRIIHESNLTFETEYSELTAQEYNQSRENRGKTAPKQPGKTEKSPYNLNPEDVIIQVKPILSPVKGKPLYDIKIGDKIMVKIPPEAPRGQYYIDLLQLKEGDTILPVPASIVDIKAGATRNDPVQILTNISTGLYGSFSEEEKQVKLKLYNPESDGPSPGPGKRSQYRVEQHVENDLSASKSTIIMMAVLVIILIIFIFLVIILW
jgi:hypothetical protein